MRMSSNKLLFLQLLTTLLLSSFIADAGSKKQSLSKIRYHFTSCGSTGYEGPTFDQCKTYYQESLSPIATDGVLFQFDEEGFRGGQGFRVPREDVYNVTIAGAAGGRGLCNIHSGRGRRDQFQIRLTTDYELLVTVGQKGKSPCDNPSEHPLCLNPPSDIRAAAQCNQTWYDSTNDSVINGVRLIYKLTGGGAGGGASILRARIVDNGVLSSLPIAVAGGGGGTSAILDYQATLNLIRNQTTEPRQGPEQSYIYHIDARFFPFTDIHRGENGTRGYRPLSQVSIVPGAGGGWTSLFLSSDTDGKSISQSVNFAEGGLDCGRILSSLQLFGEVNGGFGGGGGECGGGGGGGGFTGGAALIDENYVPGGGGHSIFSSFQDLVILSPPIGFFNDKEGFIDIVPANCNCTGYCAVNKTEDTFECFCHNDTQLAQDGFDCFFETNININVLEVLESNGFLIQGLQFNMNDSVELFSIKGLLTVGSESVCAIVFLDEDRYPVAASASLRESGVVTMLAHLMVAENYSRVVIAEYVQQFSSSIEVIGAVLVTNGSCSLDATSIEMNISTRVPLSDGYNTDIGDSITDVALIARQVLQLPSETAITQPQPEPEDTNGLVIGLVVAAIVLIIISMLIVAAVSIMWCKFCRTKSKEITAYQTPATSTVENELPVYAELRDETRELEHTYSKIETPEITIDQEKRYHTLQLVQHEGRMISSATIKDEGYELLEYEDDGVAHSTLTANLSAPGIAPLYGIIAPTHDFTQYNRERASSGVADWQYPRNKLIYIREIGEGQFGKVLLMKAQGIAGYNGKIPVAIKTLTSRDPSVISKFMEEADLMKKFSHPNIVSLLGISSNLEDDDEDSAPLMILEYMPYGDLQGFLENHKPDENGQTCIGEKQFLTFACDIALALDFLAENHYVHRDVAARNCLVSTDLHIKLADFGLSRETNEKDYYKIAGKAILPVRWMAPECLIYGIFTTAADVWSYGVVIWEIASYGDTPLDDMEAKDIVEAAQDETLQHSRPEKCPDYLYTLMSKCHTHEASERPTFGDILNILANEQSQYEVFTTKMT